MNRQKQTKLGFKFFVHIKKPLGGYIMKKTFGKLALAALLSFVPLSSASAYSYSIDYASTLDSQSILTTTVAGAIVYDFDNLTPTYSCLLYTSDAADE